MEQSRNFQKPAFVIISQLSKIVFLLCCFGDYTYALVQSSPEWLLDKYGNSGNTTDIPVTPTNATTEKPGPQNTPEGFIGVAIAIIFFGSNYVPVKRYNSGDGMFFQWVFVSAIFVVGLIVQLVVQPAKFYPLAMLGGALWATGNVCVIPILKTIGLALGILIWGSMNLLMGWASGRFGWFGLKVEKPSDVLLNYLGVGFAVMSVFVFLFVKSDGRNPETVSADSEETRPLISSKGYVQNPHNVHDAYKDELENALSDSSWVDNFSDVQRRLIGIVLSLISGTFYGFNFVPVTYIQNNYKNSSQNGLDYVFAHYCGIYLTGTVYFVFYCIIKKNKPLIYPQLILPTIVSGVMWAIAQGAWFLANAKLQQAISYPIITTGPGIIGAIWGVFFFREIKGLKNILILIVASLITIAGSILSAFSL